MEAGKHVFCEKAHAIDATGIRMVIDACAKAKQRKLSLVSGLCWRYNPAVRETIQRVWDGAIGEIIGIQASYCVGERRAYAPRPEWTEMQNQIFNWYNFQWLSGDQPSAQLIHCLDMASWAMREPPPQEAWGMGGRQVCLDPRYGDLFDHHAVVYEYANGVRLFGFCRDQPGCYGNYSTVFLGTKGRAITPQKCSIEGPNAWRYKGNRGNMYDLEHQALFDAVRKGCAHQQRQLHGHQQHVGSSRPDGLRDGAANHVGAGDAVATRFSFAAIWLGCPATGYPRQEWSVSNTSARANPVPVNVSPAIVLPRQRVMFSSSGPALAADRQQHCCGSE